MKLSIIIPCKNEEGNVELIYNKLSETLSKYKYELIYVDDGSTDKTLANLKALYEKDKEHIRVISFSKNFKKEAAMYAGISKSTGEYTCIIDGDLQQNPHYLVEMLEFLDENSDYDQVAMVMNRKKIEKGLVVFLKKIFYKMIASLSDIEFVNGASDFRMFRSTVRKAILELSENNRFSKGIFSWIGFRTKYIPYEVEPRKSGKSKFNYKENFRYALDGILAFSTKPLRVATILGVISALAAFIYFLIILIQRLAYGVDMPGYASIMCITLLLGGIQLITIGILGEYMAKTYLETKKRPIYIAREEIGFKE